MISVSGVVEIRTGKGQLHPRTRIKMLRQDTQGLLLGQVLTCLFSSRRLGILSIGLVFVDVT
jgi:hypothetical protein